MPNAKVDTQINQMFFILEELNPYSWREKMFGQSELCDNRGNPND
jgi:hypothetical protein